MGERVLILVEGQTEEQFIKHVLCSHFDQKGIFLIPIVMTTRNVLRGSSFKGGVPGYPKVRKEIFRLLGDNDAICVSTMFDFYGLPANFPGRENPKGDDGSQKALFIENEMFKDIGNGRFMPYLSMHEFEALLFSKAEEIAKALQKFELENIFASIRNKFNTPEDINDSPETCPSNRIKSVCRVYSKPYYGRLIASRIGLAQIRKECPHFNSWLNKLENLTRTAQYA